MNLNPHGVVFGVGVICAAWPASASGTAVFRWSTMELGSRIVVPRSLVASQSGFALDIPRMFIALLLITLAGVALFCVMVVLSRLALGGWHESEIARET